MDQESDPVVGTGDNKRQEGVMKPFAIMQITCNLRGQKLYGQQNVDVDLIAKGLAGSPTQVQGVSSATENATGPIPIGGFFANGEVGPPVGLTGFSSTNKQRSSIHGLATIAALFCEVQPPGEGPETETNFLQNPNVETDSPLQPFDEEDAWG